MTALQRARLDDGIEVLRLDRPQARNALDSAALADLQETLRELAADGELTGAAACVEPENTALIEWQRTGDGLPRGGLRSR